MPQRFDVLERSPYYALATAPRRPIMASAYVASFVLALLFAPSAHAQPDDESIDAELEALEAEIDGECDADDNAAEEHDSAPLDDELERMERELDQGTSTPSSPPPPTQRAAIDPAQLAQSMNPDISLIADFALAWFSDEPALLGGHDATDMGFNLQGLELGLAAGIDPYWRFDSHILISLFGLEVEEAYATTLALPFGLQ